MVFRFSFVRDQGAVLNLGLNGRQVVVHFYDAKMRRAAYDWGGCYFLCFRECYC